MDVITDPLALRRACDDLRASGRRVGLVPTMGALHEGHLSLVEEARRQADEVVVSIFVNPTQFGPGEDLDRYPRTLAADRQRCEAAGVRFVFAPDAGGMYPPGDETRVRVGATATDLCGAHRPGHFEGVATVVTKLFNVVGPCVAVFGRKDYQQLRVIHRFVADLFLPVEVVGAPTVREADGLALSSRNRYLTPADRDRALALVRGLSSAWEAFAAGERNAGKLRDLAAAPLSAVDEVDYVTVADPVTVRSLADADVTDERVLVAVAARVGGTRLIDNAVLGEDGHPLKGPRGK